MDTSVALHSSVSSLVSILPPNSAVSNKYPMCLPDSDGHHRGTQQSQIPRIKIIMARGRCCHVPEACVTDCSQSHGTPRVAAGKTGPTKSAGSTGVGKIGLPAHRAQLHKSGSPLTGLRARRAGRREASPPPPMRPWRAARRGHRSPRSGRSNPRSLCSEHPPTPPAYRHGRRRPSGAAK